jgi:hypothetical protein
MPSRFFASGSQGPINDHIVGLDDNPLPADRRGDLFREWFECLEGEVGAILASRDGDTAGHSGGRGRRSGTWFGRCFGGGGKGATKAPRHGQSGPAQKRGPEESPAIESIVIH